MRKRKSKNDDDDDNASDNIHKRSTNGLFRECHKAKDVKSLLDCARLHNKVLMPWIGFGTYRLGKAKVVSATKEALRVGYRQIDTAFIYGGETTETLVGQAIRQAIQEGIVQNRQEIFITTKQWRSYHGYDKTSKNLQLSLKRLNVDCIDLWLMHHPGPAWKRITKTTGKDDHDEDDEDNMWKHTIHGANVQSAADMDRIRADTWKAMEDAYEQGKVRAIGVCNMTVDQLERLRHGARICPMVHQCEVHPLYPQTAMLEYCAQHNILVTAYASLGGQDTNRAEWERLLGGSSRDEERDKEKPSPRKCQKAPPTDLLHAAPVAALAKTCSVSSSPSPSSPAQVLLRWALDRNCAIIPKTSSADRMRENANLFDFSLTSDEVNQLTEDLQDKVQANILDKGDERNDDDAKSLLHESTRLCWRGDPLRTKEY